MNIELYIWFDVLLSITVAILAQDTCCLACCLACCLTIMFLTCIVIGYLAVALVKQDADLANARGYAEAAVRKAKAESDAALKKAKTESEAALKKAIEEGNAVVMRVIEEGDTALKKAIENAEDKHISANCQHLQDIFMLEHKVRCLEAKVAQLEPDDDLTHNTSKA